MDKSLAGRRVALADDSTLFREGLRTLLEGQGMAVPVSVSDGTQLLKAARDRPPDVAILDVRMPPSFTDEGISTAIALRAEHPGVAVLVLSTYAESSFAARLLEPGAQGTGYLLKDRVDSIETLVEALHRLLAGGSVVDPEIIERLIGRRRIHDVVERLTARERQVLRLMAEGHSNAGVAARLYLSTKTVEANVASIFTKLDLRPNGDDNRRVLAVLTFLRAGST